MTEMDRLQEVTRHARQEKIDTVITVTLDRWDPRREVTVPHCSVMGKDNPIEPLNGELTVP